LIAYAVAGLAAGASFALLGLALTVTFRATRTVNFALAAQGTVGMFAFANLAGMGVPFLIALLCGMAVSGVIGLFMGFVLVRWFDDATPETKSVVTIAMLVSLLAIGGLVWRGRSQPVPLALLSEVVTIEGVPISQSTMIGLVLSVGLAIAISVLLGRSLVGKRLQAVSERSHTAQLVGIPSHIYGLWVWAIAGAFSAVAMWLVSSTYSSEFSRISLSVVPGLAAALFGLFKSPIRSVIGGLALGIAQSVMAGSDYSSYSTTVPFVALLLILLWSQRRERWDEAR
jgi:branched-chain amino acid transport system permease protein